MPLSFPGNKGSDFSLSPLKQFEMSSPFSFKNSTEGFALLLVYLLVSWVKTLKSTEHEI